MKQIAYSRAGYSIVHTGQWSCLGCPWQERPLGKVDHALVVVYDEQKSYLAQGGGTTFTPSNPLLRLSEGG